jgi:hypothetical protein
MDVHSIQVLAVRPVQVDGIGHLSGSVFSVNAEKAKELMSSCHVVLANVGDFDRLAGLLQGRTSTGMVVPFTR